MKNMMAVTVSLAFLFLSGCNTVGNSASVIADDNNSKETRNKIISKTPGAQEKKLGPNRWLVTYNAGIGADKVEAWTGLYERIELFSVSACNSRYMLENQEVKLEQVGDNKTQPVASAILVCK